MNKMFLPENVLACIAALEKAGYEAYAVGGCVRDSILGLTPHDYDLCTNALPEETASLFSGHTLMRSGEKHGTIGVVFDKAVIEITTFRTEGGYQDSRHPGWVRFVPDVKEDLSRRDFTVNAMAYNPKTGCIDPFGGQEDLKNSILRAVGDPTTRFTEDALRILRGVRFGVRFSLTPTEDTLSAMNALSPLMDNLARERAFGELCKLLPLLQAQDMARYATVLTQVIPPLAATLGFAQKNPHHIYDVYTHTAQVVEHAPKDLAVRWAAILHDCGKPGCFTLDEKGIGHFYGHADLSAQMADDLLLQLKAPTALRERVVFLIEKHMTPLEPDKKILRRRLGQYGTDALKQLLALQKADCIGTGTHTGDRFDEIFALIEEILQEQACLTIKDLAINGKDLQEIGFAPGKKMGACLNLLLEQVQDERLPNEKEVLLSTAKNFFTKRGVFMNYREPLETAKPYKEAYLSGLTRLIAEKQAEAAEIRREYSRDIFTDPERYRKDLRDLLGWPLTEPSPADLPPVSAEKLSEEDGYTVYRLQVEVLPGVKLAGLFFRMNGEDAKPLVLVQHGKLGTPERISGVYGGTSNYNHMLSRIISHNVHAFAPQLCLWSESYEVPFDREEMDARLKRVGSSIAAVEIYGLTRILDYFEAQSYVSCLGMAGMSYGGFYTLMTAALDTRLRAAICCSYFNKRDAVPWSDWVWFGSGLKFDDAQLACLICPRKLYVLMGNQDALFDYRNTIDSYKEATQMCDKDWMQLHIYDGNHEFCPDDEPIEALIRDLKA